MRRVGWVSGIVVVAMLALNIPPVKLTHEAKGWKAKLGRDLGG